MKVEFLNSLDVRELPHGFKQLLNPFYAKITLDEGGAVEVIIPEGFTTDYCSVPRIPFAYLLFGGMANEAGVLHDALYSPWPGIIVANMHTREAVEVTREWADSVLYFALETCGVGWFARRMMYTGVKLAGWKFYKKGSTK
jgi:hypothetical protein